MTRSLTTFISAVLMIAPSVNPTHAESFIQFISTQKTDGCSVKIDGRIEVCEPVMRYVLTRNDRQMFAFAPSGNPMGMLFILGGLAARSDSGQSSVARIDRVNLGHMTMPAKGSCAMTRHQLRANDRGGFYATMDTFQCSVKAQGHRIELALRGDGSDPQIQENQ